MYELIYNFDGKVSAIKRISDGACIPICEGNMDYQEFLTWNQVQSKPLDLNSTIEVEKPIDPKIEWRAATTQAQKISILAKKVGLE